MLCFCRRLTVPVLTFLCLCLYSSFPSPTHFATAESRPHCGSFSLSDSIWGGQEDPDSLSFRTQCNSRVSLASVD